MQHFTIYCSDQTLIQIEDIQLIQGIPYFDTLLNTKIGDNTNFTTVECTGRTMSNIINLNYFNTVTFQIDEEFMYSYCFFNCVLPSDDLDDFANHVKKQNRLHRLDKIQNLLMPHQPTHIQSMEDRLQKHISILDYSNTGYGKTYTACGLACVLGLSITVVCEKIMISKWIRVSRLFGMKVVFIKTYASFSYVRDNKTTHQYLDYSDYTSSFIPTASLIRLIDSGTLFVIDECQKCRNKSNISDSIITITNSIYDMGIDSTRSRILCLSATPFDKEDHIINIARVLGMSGGYRKWWQLDRSTIPVTVVPTGLLVLDTYSEYGCEFVARRTVGEYKHDIVSVFYKIKDAISCQMYIEEMDTDPVVIKNLLCTVNDEEREIAERGITLMREAISINDENGVTITEWPHFMKGLNIIQSAKTGPMVRMCMKDLTNWRKYKVVLFIPLLKQVKIASEDIQEAGYDVLVMTGETSIEDRAILISAFNEDNNDYRVLITNTKIASVGIDLDDKIGNRRRKAYIAAEYNFLNMIQAANRFRRVDSKSDPIVSIVYITGADDELRILEALIKKSSTLKKMIERDTGHSNITQEVDTLL